MQKILPHFFDLQHNISYTLNENTLSHSGKKPKSTNILCPPLSYFTYFQAEIDVQDLQNEHISSFLFSLAYKDSVLSAPAYAYELYFTHRAHLFDEQKCVCECFFYHKLECTNDFALPKSPIITCDIFLPCALKAFDTNADCLVFIESYLCYFENNVPKEVLSCKQHLRTFAMLLQDSQKQSQEVALKEQLKEWHSHISAHIIYLQEAYKKYFTQIYYFLPEDKDTLTSLAHFSHSADSVDFAESAESDSHNSLLISTPFTQTQALFIAPLSDICALKKDLSLQDFRAMLALHYALLAPQESLANFAPKSNPRKRLYYALMCVSIMFLCVLPLCLKIYTYYLEHDIAELQAKSEALFTHQDSQSNQLAYDTFVSLTQRQNELITNLQDLSLWQQSYNKRYVFMQDIFNTRFEGIAYDDVSFYFSPSVFVASLKVSAQNNIDISTFLAYLNVGTQKAFLQDSKNMQNVKDSLNRDSTNHINQTHNIESFHAHIILVHYAI